MKNYNFDARKKRLIKRYKQAVKSADKNTQEYCSWELCTSYGQTEKDFPPK